MSKVTFSIASTLEKLSRQLRDIEPRLEKAVNDSVAEVAQAAHASIVAKAQRELGSTRADFLNALRFEKVGENEYLIALDGRWPNMLEDGFPAFDQRPGMLASQKIVHVGSRAGQPWVQEGKDGQKYAHVPMQKHPYSKDPGSSDMASAIRKLKAENAAGKKQNITKIFKDLDGNPVEGEVARAKSDNPKLDGLVKYQKAYGKTVQSIYVTYRTVSSKGKPWRHPGFDGIHSFDDAAKLIEQQLHNIVKDILGK